MIGLQVKELTLCRHLRHNTIVGASARMPVGGGGITIFSGVHNLEHNSCF